jgi:hypothetical protein
MIHNRLALTLMLKPKKQHLENGSPTIVNAEFIPSYFISSVGSYVSRTGNWETSHIASSHLQLLQSKLRLERYHSVSPFSARQFVPCRKKFNSYLCCEALKKAQKVADSVTIIKLSKRFPFIYDFKSCARSSIRQQLNKELQYNREYIRPQSLYHYRIFKLDIMHSF